MFRRSTGVRGFICKNSRDSRGLISISGNIRVTLGNRQGSVYKYGIVEGLKIKCREGFFWKKD